MTSIRFLIAKPEGDHMLSLVEIPPTVKKYAENYQDFFSPEQYGHSKRYLTSLFVSETKTIQAINEAFVVQVKNQSSLNRFFTEYPRSATAVNEPPRKSRRQFLLSQAATADWAKKAAALRRISLARFNPWTSLSSSEYLTGALERRSSIPFRDDKLFVFNG